jgi:tetratricopeptide (TPR) repeat protein
VVRQHLAALEEAWRRDPLALFVRLADAYLAVERLDDASAVLQHGLAARPGSLSGRVLKARLAMARHRPAAARAELDDVLALRDDHWSALALLVQVHRFTGDRECELLTVERLLRIVPGDAELIARRAALENDDGERPHMPRQDATVGAQTEPARAVGPQAGLPVEGLRPTLASDPFVNATMAELLAAQGDVDGALAMLRQLVERCPERQALRARYVELGGDGADLPPPAPPAAPDAALLEDVLQGLVGDP